MTSPSSPAGLGSEAARRTALARLHPRPAQELVVQHVATHGRTGAVNGTLKLNGGQTIAFCDVVEFASAKGDRVKEISSYRIELG